MAFECGSSLVPFVFFIIENLNPFNGRKNTPRAQLIHKPPRSWPKADRVGKSFYFKNFPTQIIRIPKSKLQLFIRFLFVVRSVLRPTSFFGLFSGYFPPKSPFFFRVNLQVTRNISKAVISRFCAARHYLFLFPKTLSSFNNFCFCGCFLRFFQCLH